ncbi:UNKNOWN [Stylonychia lemnae]|uniref:Uncharacterized protein n=1 Tax=Stylonychia lemnae TaxID=5949 RepID=A0A078AV77_STYLE|nr:UNKNOWN [Stylonychia lemnae]|eukprot:CDW86295.1 UNKNOWN [Stylonychia lemnae]
MQVNIRRNLEIELDYRNEQQQQPQPKARSFIRDFVNFTFIGILFNIMITLVVINSDPLFKECFISEELVQKLQRLNSISGEIIIISNYHLAVLVSIIFYVKKGKDMF